MNGFTQSPFTPTFTDSMDGTRRTGYPSTMTADGKKYFLRQDTELDKRLAANEAESARRSGRPVQKILPNYRYVDEQGKPFQGTFLGGGSYGGFGKEKEVPSPTISGITQPTSLTQATELRETDLGQAGQPMAFTGFGQMARNQKADQYQTPIGRGLAASGMQIPSTGFGDVSLRFPFAGAESAFERATRTTTAGTSVGMPTAAFGDMPMFPSSRFGGPQPAQTMGPLETQPRRPWMY